MSGVTGGGHHRPPATGGSTGWTQPPPGGIRVVHELDRSLRLAHGAVELARYVYRPWDEQRESPRPYLHPVRTLAGDVVTLFRPHDHVWHKGIAWSLPNVGPANFWGGPTYVRGRGYVQLRNNGSMLHRDFDSIRTTPGSLHVTERLDWVTHDGAHCFAELRRLTFAVHEAAGAWSLAFETDFVNVGAGPVAIGSPTTEGRENAGYGGLFWRGPRSFTGGTLHVPGRSGGDEFMGIRAPWMAFTGQHDDHGRHSTLVFVDAPSNPEHPTQWFARSGMFAGVGAAPFFSRELAVAPGERVRRAYAIVVAGGDRGRDGSGDLAEVGLDALATAADDPAGPAGS